jgi:hypothetical protein
VRILAIRDDRRPTMSFRELNDVQKWVAEKGGDEGDGVAALEEAIARGAFGDARSVALADAYLERIRAAAAERASAAETQRREREVAAAEKAANAADQSAAAAKRSAQWSFGALIVAVVSAAVAVATCVWPPR